MEGASGPGVGSARTVVQAGCVGTMMLGMAREVLMGVGEELQAVRKVRSRKKEGKRKERATFLGREMDFPTGMLHLARCAGAAIIPCIHLYDRGRITILLKEPIDHAWEKGEAEYKRIVSEYANLLETYLLKYPEQYMGVYGPTVLSEYYDSHHDEKRIFL